MQTTHQYSFHKETDGWIIHLPFEGQDYKLSKENMKETLYDIFEAILPEESKAGLERARAKLPAYLQFKGHQLQTEAGQIETTIELYIRRHQIEQVSIIVLGTNGGTAKVPVNQFKLPLGYFTLKHDALAEESGIDQEG